MHTRNLADWRHDHVFGQDRPRPAERRTLLIVAVTAVMMVVEIAGGIAFGSMALLADGLHMASHTAALGIAVVAYVYARRHAADRRFTFGTGKIDSLAGFASALLLGVFAVLMAVESVERLVDPVAIAFDQALLVAVVGLLVNGASAWLLATTPAHPAPGLHAHGHAHGHSHGHAHSHSHGHAHHHAGGHRHDHTLRAAYLHVLADALTSLLAIVALLAAKHFGAVWLDPVMGIVGAVLVARWAAGLMIESAWVLVDRQAGAAVTDRLRAAIEAGSSDRVADLHVWTIGPGLLAAEIVVVSDVPQPPDQYRARIPADLGIVHAAVEVQTCPWHDETRADQTIAGRQDA